MEHQQYSYQSKGHFEQEDNAKGEGFVYDDINRLDSLILEKLHQKRNDTTNTNGSTHCSQNIIEKLANQMMGLQSNA